MRTTTTFVLFLGLGLAANGCNLISGSDDISIVDDDGAPPLGVGGSGGVFSVGSNGGAGPSGVGVTSTGSSGGAPGSTSAGSTVASSSSGATTGATSSSSATSGGGPMCAGAGPTTTPLDAEEEAFLVAINDYRMQNGLNPVEHCVSLDRAAQGHSEDMRDQNYFDHQGLNGSSPWERACDACFDQGCGPSTAMAENIAAGNSSGQATFTQWQNSPGHNANMLGSNFTMIGIGRATGGGMYGVYWTTVFAGSDEPSCY